MAPYSAAQNWTARPALFLSVHLILNSTCHTMNFPYRLWTFTRNTKNPNDSNESGNFQNSLELCNYNHLKNLTKNLEIKTKERVEFGFTKIRQILGHFHNDEALPLRCNCSVPCFRKEITIRNETGRRYQKNTARFHVSIFFYRIIGLDNFANTSDCVSMSSKEPKEF